MKTKTNILFLTYWSYQDALVQTYTLPYIRIIQKKIAPESKLYLLTLERNSEDHSVIEIEPGIIHFSFGLKAFGIGAALNWIGNLFRLKKLIRKENIDVIHSWCTPAGGIGWILSKWSGKPLVIDSFEPHAEPMVETGTWGKRGFAFRILFWLEKKQVHHAKYVIAASPHMKEYAKLKYGYTGSMFVKPACIDLDQFSLTKRKNPSLLKELQLENKIVLVYAGKFSGLYYREETFDFFREAINHWGDRLRILLLTNENRNDIEQLSKRKGIDSSLITSLFVPHKEIPEYLGLGDFAISPLIPVPSRLCSTPIKTGEYWAMGLPVVIPEGISTDSQIIRESETGAVLKDFSANELLNAIRKIDQLIQPENRQLITEKIRGLAIRYRNFNIADDIYSKIYS